MATKSKFNLIKVLSSVTDTKAGVVRRVELYEYAGSKFKFTFENSNGTPLGFDYKHGIKVFNLDSDEWKNIADKSDILAFATQKIDCCNYYGNAFQLERGAIAFMEACKEFVKALYDK